MRVHGVSREPPSVAPHRTRNSFPTCLIAFFSASFSCWHHSNRGHLGSDGEWGGERGRVLSSYSSDSNDACFKTGKTSYWWLLLDCMEFFFSAFPLRSGVVDV